MSRLQVCRMALVLTIWAFVLGHSTARMIEINGRLCEYFTCPKNCTLTFRNGCPHNCNCKKPVVCPRVDCPYEFPQCLIFTMLDGCQSCACQKPAVVLVEGQNGDNKRVVLVRTSPFPGGQVQSSTSTAIDLLQLQSKLATTTQAPLTAFSALETTQAVMASHTSNLPDDISLQEVGNTTILRLGNESVILPSKVLGLLETTTAINRDSEICISAFQELVDGQFSPLYRELQQHKDKATLAFPPAFSYNKNELQTVCATYEEAKKHIPGRIVRYCRGHYRQFDEVLSNYEYPCGYATTTSFFRYYDCLMETSKNATVKDCEQRASGRLKDPFLNMCDVYNVLTNCIYESVVYSCGYDAWEVEFQFLSLNVRQFVSQCYLNRITRTVRL